MDEVTIQEQLETLLNASGKSQMYVRSDGSWVLVGEAEFVRTNLGPVAFVDLSTDTGKSVAALITAHFMGLPVLHAS